METFGCRGNTIKLGSNGYLDYNNPQPEQFTFMDIVRGLARMPRFSGQGFFYYSVAEHLILCHEAALDRGWSEVSRLAVFLHDASEAFTGDVPKPLKNMIPDVSVIENRLMNAIAKKFNVNFREHHHAIKVIDRSMLLHERDSLFISDGMIWHGEDNYFRMKKLPRLRGWSPEFAMNAFIEHANRYFPYLVSELVSA